MQSFYVQVTPEIHFIENGIKTNRVYLHDESLSLSSAISNLSFQKVYLQRALWLHGRVIA